MEINREQLAANFKLKETHELLRIYANDLTEVARTVLHQELLARDIPEEKLQNQRAVKSIAALQPYKHKG